MWFKRKPDITTAAQAELLAVVLARLITWYKVQLYAGKDKKQIDTPLHNIGTFFLGALNTPLGRSRFENLLLPEFEQNLACSLADLAVCIEVEVGSGFIAILRQRFIDALYNNYLIDMVYLKDLTARYPHIWLVPFIQELWRQQTGS